MAVIIGFYFFTVSLLFLHFTEAIVLMSDIKIML